MLLRRSAYALLLSAFGLGCTSVGDLRFIGGETFDSVGIDDEGHPRCTAIGRIELKRGGVFWMAFALVGEDENASGDNHGNEAAVIEGTWGYRMGNELTLVVDGIHGDKRQSGSVLPIRQRGTVLRYQGPCIALVFAMRVCL